MHNNNIFKNRQKGVSLIATFFILTIILAVVLNISILLYNGIKIIRNVGNSVVAFYAADSGVEKFLYYDRKQMLHDKRGLCYMCDSDNPNICPDCQECVYTNLDIDGCNPLFCDNCEIEFNSFFNGKSYNLVARTITIDGVVDTSIDSKGDYENVSRKIQLQVEGDGSAGTGQQSPSVITACLLSRSIELGIDELTIYAEISDPDGVASVVAYIQSYPDEDYIDSVDLTGTGGVYTGTWIGNEEEVYYVDIEACDTKDNCGITDNIQKQCSY